MTPKEKAAHKDGHATQQIELVVPITGPAAECSAVQAVPVARAAAVADRDSLDRSWFPSWSFAWCQSFGISLVAMLQHSINATCREKFIR